MKFDVITIFPEIFKSYLGESLIARAQKKKLIKINVHNLRKWGKGPHKQVDDRPFGGGLGMVMQVEPIYKAVKKIKKRGKTKIILFTPRGKKFNQKLAFQFSKLDQIIFICGRYEGVDERVAKNIADVELSIGDYDLMGGELPAMVAIETISRLIPGVLGKPQLLEERVTKKGGFLEYAQYTRPEIFNVGKYEKRGRACPPKSSNKKFWRVPKLLLSGDHKKIEEWKKSHSKEILS
ncbi:MAG: tRNA (guanosine(37)-N1)-methyltransferase TrmD [Patescibacteria group bacterium]